MTSQPDSAAAPAPAARPIWLVMGPSVLTSGFAVEGVRACGPTQAASVCPESPDQWPGGAPELCTGGARIPVLVPFTLLCSLLDEPFDRMS